MVGSVTSFGGLNLTQGVMARGVSPVAEAPTPRDQGQQAAPQRGASTVALAPAAMTALIEAQERLSQDAPALVRHHTAQQIDQLIYRLDGAPHPANLAAQAPFAVRQLQSARDALSTSIVDLQA